MPGSVSQLKEEARRAEKREDWSRAIELYREALRISEESGDISLDLSLYNRIGDLYRRRGDADEAVLFYRKAVHQYADQGLHTGAVALCNKILRLAPDHVDTYRVLGRLHASSGLAAEARNAFREYAERMEERGDRAAAQDAYLELGRAVGDVELIVDVLGRMASSGRESAAREALLEVWREREETAREPEPRLRELAEEWELDDALSGASREEEPAAGSGAGPRAEGDEGPRQRDAGDDSPEPEDGSEGDETAAVELEEILLQDPEAGQAIGRGEGDDPGDGTSSSTGPAVGEGEGEAARGTDGAVDLGERIRRRLESGRPADQEGVPAPRDFDDMLVGFRAQAAETSGEADPAAHVELGVALRQMGLLGDAIREFQVAARASDPPLRSFELLGECFLEKDLHSVAVRVLNRALRLPGYSDHELLGVLYQLGVAYQSVDDFEGALDCFERVFSVDIDFRDVADRMETVRSKA